MKTTKNFKALENVLNDCSNMGDTLFAIYGVNGASESKKGGQLIFTGDPKMIADGMVQIIRKSLAEDADNGSMAIANALLNAIVTVLTPKDEISLKFADFLKDAIDTVAKRRFEKKKARKLRNVPTSQFLHLQKSSTPSQRIAKSARTLAIALCENLFAKLKSAFAKPKNL